MNCTQAQHLLAALMNGESHGEEARAVRFHLSSCNACASTLTPGQWVEVLPVLEDELEPSGEFRQRFYQKLEDRRPSWTRRILVWRWPQQLAAAAAILAVFAVGVLIGRYPGIKKGNLPDDGNVQIVEKLPILQDMAVINNLDLLEDFEAIEELPNLMNVDSRN